MTSPGAFVRCAVTGESIPLDELRYWSVARQEPYLNAAVSLQRELEANPALSTPEHSRINEDQVSLFVYQSLWLRRASKAR